VRVVAPTFVDQDTVVNTRADDVGAFGFSLHSDCVNLRLVIDAAYHAQIERSLPPASDMLVSLVSRRRLLLDRLLKWARQAGRPWDRDPAPTPQHIANVALERGGGAVARWAKRVESGAFGPEPVDERLDKEVRELEPR